MSLPASHHACARIYLQLGIEAVVTELSSCCGCWCSALPLGCTDVCLGAERIWIIHLYWLSKHTSDWTDVLTGSKETGGPGRIGQATCRPTSGCLWRRELLPESSLSHTDGGTTIAMFCVSPWWEPSHSRLWSRNSDYAGLKSLEVESPKFQCWGGGVRV